MTEEQEREWADWIAYANTKPYRKGDSAILAADDDLRALRARVAELEGAIRWASDLGDIRVMAGGIDTDEFATELLRRAGISPGRRGR